MMLTTIALHSTPGGARSLAMTFSVQPQVTALMDNACRLCLALACEIPVAHLNPGAAQ